MDEAPNPPQRMQFGITMVAPAENSDNTINFDDPSDTPPFLTSLCKISMTTILLQWQMKEKQLLINLLKTVQSPQVSARMQESVRVKVFAICLGLWPNQCHNKSSMEETKCTAWHHKLLEYSHR